MCHFRIHFSNQETATRGNVVLSQSTKGFTKFPNGIFRVNEDQLKQLCAAGITFDYLKEKDESDN